MDTLARELETLLGNNIYSSKYDQIIKIIEKIGSRASKEEIIIDLQNIQLSFFANKLAGGGYNYHEQD